MTRRRPAFVFFVAAAVAVAALGVALVFRFVAQERARDLAAWQMRLGIVADSRKAAIDTWLAQQWRTLDGIAGNISVQLFLSEVKLAAGRVRDVPDGASQSQYIGNLLVFTAAQDRFAAALPAPNLPVNIDRPASAGLALFDADGQLLAATPGAPAAEPWVAALVAAAHKGKTNFRDLYVDAAGNPAMAFLAPVFATQEAAMAASQVGWVLGVKEVAGELYPLLRQPGESEATAEALLVRPAGATVEYLSPLPKDKPLSLALSTATQDLAEAAAIRTTGGFGIAHDYRGVEVLYTSRAIADLPWVLVYTVDRAEALADTDARSLRLISFFLLAIAMIAALFAAVWRHGASRRAERAAEQYRSLAERFQHQSTLLRLVTDGQPGAIFIADAEGRYSFANRRAAAEAGIGADDMLGKSLAAVIGPAKASRYLALNRRAAQGNEIVEDVLRTGSGAALTVLHSQHIPLEPAGDNARGVLVIEEDLSLMTAEQERRRNTLDHLVRCLISLADRRDPKAAGHSGLVAQVARATAAEMCLEPVLIETAEMAGRLMNLGKILVPASILTRAGPLSPAEIEQLHESLLEATRFLDGIEFDGPVLETLRQCQEHWDGSGRPKHLKRREIIPTARVLAVANAFVGLLSPRSYRAALTLDEATKILLRETGSRFDPAAVAALVNHLENKGGRADWAAARPAAPMLLAAVDPP